MKRDLPLLLSACLLLAACDPVTLGLVTAGGGVAVNRQYSSTITRTFSLGSAPVQTALLTALDRMSIQVTRHEKRGEVDYIEGTAGKRVVSLEVEPVTRTSTLIQVAVRQDLLTLDGATGREIVAQTELALSQQASPSGTARTGQSSLAGAGGSGSEAATGKTTYYGYDRPSTATVAKAGKPRTHTTPATSSGDGIETHRPAQAQGPMADHLAAAAAP